MKGSAVLRELGRREEHSDVSRCEGCASVCLASFPLDASAALMKEVSKDIFFLFISAFIMVLHVVKL